MKHFLKYHDEIKKENLTETCEISNHTLNNRKQCALTEFRNINIFKHDVKSTYKKHLPKYVKEPKDDIQTRRTKNVQKTSTHIHKTAKTP